MQKCKFLAFAVPVTVFCFWISAPSPAKRTEASKSNRVKPKSPSSKTVKSSKANSPKVASSVSSDFELTLVKKVVLVSKGLGLQGVKFVRQSTKSFLPTMAFASDTANRQVGTINLIRSVGGAKVLSSWRLKEHVDVINKPKGDDDDDDWSAIISPVITSVSPTGKYILFYNDDGSDSHVPMYVLDTQRSTLSELKIKSIDLQRLAWSSDERQMAYIHGGGLSGLLADSVQGEYLYLGPLSLNVYDFQTKKAMEVITTDSLNGAFWWSNENKLIYGALPNLKAIGAKEQLRPNVYEYSTTPHKSRVVIEDGYNPKPSPDGKYLAFYGSPNVNNPLPPLDTSRNNDSQIPWRESPSGASLCVENLVTHKRVAFKPYYNSYPTILWLAGGKSFVPMEVNDVEKNDFLNVRFDVRDIEEQSIRGSFASKSVEIYSTFGLIKSSTDAKSFYFCEIYSRTDKTNEASFTMRINKMDIRSGKITLESEISGIGSVDIVSS